MLITNGTLQITNVTRSDASTFACVVSNVAGSGYATVSINVEWKPKFIHDAKRIISVVVGDDTYLDCQVDAKPVPKVSVSTIYLSIQDNVLKHYVILHSIK